jgi:class 3 adenylate cyclase
MSYPAGRRSSKPPNEGLFGMTVTRRLAAILAADVAGYSRLMGTDEEGTLTRLKAHRQYVIIRSE